MRSAQSWAEHDAGFYRLTEPDLISEDHPFGERRSQSEQHCLDLVRVQVHGRVEQRHGQPIYSTRRPAGEVMGEVFCVVRGHLGAISQCSTGLF